MSVQIPIVQYVSHKQVECFVGGAPRTPSNGDGIQKGFSLIVQPSAVVLAGRGGDSSEVASAEKPLCCREYTYALTTEGRRSDGSHAGSALKRADEVMPFHISSGERLS